VSAERIAAIVALGLLGSPALVGCSELHAPASEPAAWVEIRSTRVEVEVAVSPEEQRQGLSGRAKLDWGDGMVFLYKTGGFQSFWMIDMRFPIDMVWIRDSRVVGVHHNVPVPEPDTPHNELPRYGPKELVDTVLEVPAGYARAHGWARGDAVSFGGDASVRSEPR
ncbi:MAG: DUF192 domain-containing protein, partial [Myxococcota bacterium]|nr:DUF192 domain-containing protein [Myxococcota bacterium]